MLWASSSPDAERMRVIIPYDLIMEMKTLWGLLSQSRHKIDEEARTTYLHG